MKTPTAGKSLAKAVTGSSGEDKEGKDGKVELGKVEGSLSKSRSSSVSSLDQVASHSFYPQGVFYLFYYFTIFNKDYRLGHSPDGPALRE